jgi:pyruvate/2-oxoglutarate dehydrogenase complex dihydrolipoamide acyltransferase (E2) component
VNGSTSVHPEINIGFAIDAEGGPELPVVRGADRKSLPEIIAEVDDHLALLRQGAPSPEIRSGGNFTISHLVDLAVSAYIPSPVLGRSAILGVCGESPAPGGSGELLHLALAFDPRATGALRSARFLNDLKARLLAYDASLHPTDGTCGDNREVARFARCLMPIRELRELGASLIPRVDRDGSESPVCSLCITGF